MRRRAPSRINALSVAKLIRYMQDVPSNVGELAEASGLGVHAARRFVLAMEREGVIHVAQWESDKIGRYCRKVYAFGQGKDAKKPPPRKHAPGYRAQRRRQERMLSALAGTSRPHPLPEPATTTSGL